MITINNKKIEVNHFPDNTQLLNYQVENETEFNINWCYDNDEECMTLWYLVHHIRTKCNHNIKINLDMYYTPNARFDRVKNDDAVFTLKYFADFINSFNFDKVVVYNVHSNVSEALINNIFNMSPNSDVGAVISKYKPDVIYFPDEGACKRYADLACIKNYDLPVIFGIKKRDFATGKILGLDVVSDIDLTGKKVLIVDDICSAGGTFKFSAMKLKELGASDVALYISHCEDNIQNGDLLKTDLVSKIYTTDSILHISDPKIQIIRKFRN